MKRLDPTLNDGSTAYADGNPTTGAGGTVPQADPLNHIQEELCYLVEQAGITLDSPTGTKTQVRAAVLAMINAALPQLYLGGTTLTGANYALTGTATTAPDMFAVKFVAANPASATLTIGATAYTLVDQDGTALPAGNLSAGDTRVLVKDGTTLRVQAADDVLNADMLLQLASAQAGTFAGVGKPSAAPTLANPQTELTNTNGEVFRWNGSSWYLAGNGKSFAITGTKTLTNSVQGYDATWTAPRAGVVAVMGNAYYRYNAAVGVSGQFRFSTYLYKNAAIEVEVGGYYAFNAGQALVQLDAPSSPFISVAAGDVISLATYQDAGVNLTNGFAKLFIKYTD